MIATEPVSWITSFVAGLSAGVLALFGVSYLSFVWAFFGALVMALISPPSTNKGAVLVSVFCGTMSGAVLSNLVMALGVAVMFKDATPAAMNFVLMGLAFLIGAGFKQIIEALLKRVIDRIANAGGPA